MHYVQTRGFPHTSCSGHWHKLSKQGQIICLFNLVFNVWFLFSFSHWFLFSIKLKLVLDQLQDKCKIIYNAVVEKVVNRYVYFVVWIYPSTCDSPPERQSTCSRCHVLWSRSIHQMLCRFFAKYLRYMVKMLALWIFSLGTTM